MSDEKNLNDNLNVGIPEAGKVVSEAKNVAVIAHITLIGWVIALIMNSNKKTEFGSFYINKC